VVGQGQRVTDSAQFVAEFFRLVETQEAGRVRQMQLEQPEVFLGQNPVNRQKLFVNLSPDEFADLGIGIGGAAEKQEKIGAIDDFVEDDSGGLPVGVADDLTGDRDLLAQLGIVIVFFTLVLAVPEELCQSGQGNDNEYRQDRISVLFARHEKRPAVNPTKTFRWVSAGMM
jgi:hypothetical protein